jgi:ABC-type Zn2+ transport system substrate-binding protein/surface adhesin
VKTNETLDQLKKLLEANPKDKSIQKCIEVYEEDLKRQKSKVEKKDKKQKAKNMRIFRKIVSFYDKIFIKIMVI